MNNFKKEIVLSCALINYTIIFGAIFLSPLNLHFNMFFLFVQEWISLGCTAQTQKKLEECTGNATVDILSKCLCTANYTVNYMLEENNVTCTNTTNVAVAELYFE